MIKTRKVTVITGKGELACRELEMPELKENEVLIKVHRSLISPGTELLAARKLREDNNPDLEESPFGYANAGEVLEVKGNRKGIKPGTRVAAMGGGAALHANYVCVPVNLVVPIPDNITYEQATFACLGATALQAVRRSDPKLGEYGIILGLGIVGNLAGQLSMLSGGRVIAWEGFENRIKIARECGISNYANFKTQDAVKLTKEFATPYGADFAIMAFGGNGTPAFNNVKECMKLSADGHKMGRITLVGGCTIEIGGGAASGNLDIRSASRTGPGYHDSNYEYGADYPEAFVQFTTQRNLREIITLISEGRLKVDPLNTHNIPIDKAAEAGDLLIDTPDKAIGITLEMSH